jgi:hypothetical protein
MDDFMMIAQAPTHVYTRNNLLFHLDSIFRDPTDTPRHTIVSEFKVLKGDATFTTTKQILRERLAELLHSFTCRNHTMRTKWHKLLGKLRSKALAIHSAKYLFSALQFPLVHTYGDTTPKSSTYPPHILHEPLWRSDYK